MSTPRTADVVVIGAGIHGLSAAWSLARRGLSVLQIEQFASGHGEGSSHGATRMIRRAYPNQIWDPLVEAAYVAWQKLSEVAGEQLINVVGGLYSRPAGVASSLRGPGCRTLTAEESFTAFPGLRVAEGSTSLYDPAAGIIRADAALRVLRRLGRAAGVSTLGGTRVLSWMNNADSALLDTTAGPISAGRVIVCAGPWTGSLLPEFAPQLNVVRIVNAYLASSTPALVAPPNLGVFSFQTEDDRLFYGFGSFEGRDLKVGLDDGPIDRLDVPRAPVSVEEENALLVLARRFVRGADGPVTDSLSCRYTMAPKSRFAIGAVPGRGNTLVAAACSGHGFKFGPAVGEALADLVEGLPRPDLDFLAPDDLLLP